jgi:hypothetical protein
MGKPIQAKVWILCKLCRELTQGSKTFQYLEEKKTIVISLVAASENEEAQTRFHSHHIFSGVVGMMPGVVRRKCFGASQRKSYKISH